MKDSNEQIKSLERPHPNLLKYYFILSLLLGPLFPIVFLPRYFRFKTLRYRFDDEGVTMSWGLVFRREISLTYARLQDIHLVSNLVERWLGLARVQLQTAAGSATAEMTLEGLQEFELLRDFLYTRMRGTKPASSKHPADFELSAPGAFPGATSEVAGALQQAASELRLLREELARLRTEAS